MRKCVWAVGLVYNWRLSWGRGRGTCGNSISRNCISLKGPQDEHFFYLKVLLSSGSWLMAHGSWLGAWLTATTCTVLHVVFADKMAAKRAISKLLPAPLTPLFLTLLSCVPPRLYPCPLEYVNAINYMNTSQEFLIDSNWALTIFIAFQNLSWKSFHKITKVLSGLLNSYSHRSLSLPLPSLSPLSLNAHFESVCHKMHMPNGHTK